jgi:hypothetical protein
MKLTLLGCGVALTAVRLFAQTTPDDGKVLATFQNP